MIDFSKKDRSRQDSVLVDGIEYKIHTEFYHWINFGKKFENWKKEGRETFNLDEFDYLYSRGVPENKQAGFEELSKFHHNKQPLPRDTGKESSVETLDWITDSERIRAAFLSNYNIDLLTAELHWHDFQGLFNAFFWSLKDVVSARLYKEKPEKTGKIEKENREMWKLESDEEKQIFKMR